MRGGVGRLEKGVSTPAWAPPPAESALPFPAQHLWGPLSPRPCDRALSEVTQMSSGGSTLLSAPSPGAGKATHTADTLPGHGFSFHLPGTWGQVARSSVFPSHWGLLFPLGLSSDILGATRHPPCHPSLGLCGTLPSPVLFTAPPMPTAQPTPCPVLSQPPAGRTQVPSRNQSVLISPQIYTPSPSKIKD